MQQGLYAVDGGDAIQLDGTLSLCGRADGDAERFYTGLLAQLSLWDRALNADEIAALYTHISQHFKVRSLSLQLLVTVKLLEGCSTSDFQHFQHFKVRLPSLQLLVTVELLEECNVSISVEMRTE